MSFRERWINLLHSAATGTKRTRTLLTPIGVSVFLGFTALFVVAANLVDSLLGLPSLLPDSVKLQLSIPVMSVGLAVTIWSALHFLRVKGTPVPFNPPPTLVTTGPYRFSRNPMLAGVFLLMFGIGFAFNSVSLVCVFVPLFILVNVWELKEIEEPELEKRLGSEYLDYKRRTPIFIPRVSQGEQSGSALRRGPRCSGAVKPDRSSRRARSLESSRKPSSVNRSRVRALEVLQRCNKMVCLEKRSCE